MKRIFKILAFIFVFLLATLFVFVGKSSGKIEREKFPEGKTCASWYGKKSMAFRPLVGMTGINCSIDVSTEKSGKMVMLVVKMPLSGFDSGSSGRDEYFRKTLKEDVSPDLVFLSEAMSPDSFLRFKSVKLKNLSGNLTIGKKSYPVNFSLAPAGSLVTGSLVSNYAAFGLKPHTILWGIIARAQDYLELHFQLDPAILTR